MTTNNLALHYEAHKAAIRFETSEDARSFVADPIGLGLEFEWMPNNSDGDNPFDDEMKPALSPIQIKMCQVSKSDPCMVDFTAYIDMTWQLSEGKSKSDVEEWLENLGGNFTGGYIFPFDGSIDESKFEGYRL